MTKEELLLIEVSKAYFNGTDINIPDDINWHSFCLLAKHHNLVGICHCVLVKSNAPKNVLDAFREKFLELVYAYECQSGALGDIDNILTSAEIEYILFKGSTLRDIYPVPESRSMGDIDFLIKPEDRDKVKKLLEQNGYSCYRSNGPVYEYFGKNVTLEVHTKIIREFGEKAFSDAFENAEFDGCKGKLEDSYHFAYLIAHIAHHFRFYGAGLKLILDLAIMLCKCNIDMDKVFEILGNINLDRFSRVILSVCYKWFGVGECYIDDTAKTERYLLKCGAFGSLNENKGAVVARKDLEEGKSISSSLLTKLRLAFPPYKKLKELPYISFINGRPWLTVLAWVYRFFYNLKHKRKVMIKTVKSIDNENTQTLAKEELEYFEEIGLI